MRYLHMTAAALLLQTQVLHGQAGNPLPEPTADISRATSPTDNYERESQFKKKYLDEAERRKKAEEELARLRGKSTPIPVVSPHAKVTVTPSATVTPKGDAKKSPLEIVIGTQPKVKSKQKQPSLPVVSSRPVGSVVSSSSGVSAQTLSSQVQYQSGNIVLKPLVFGLSAKALDERNTVVPLGSYVKARILTGVEANTVEPYPILLQLDHAFVGPNKTRIDLSHCFIIAKAKANLSTERVLGETQEISCVRENGEHVKRAAPGYLAGEDSTFGVTGELISRQGQVLLAAVIANLAKGAGDAVKLANSTTKVTTGPGGAIEKSQVVTGSTGAFVAASATANAAEMIAQWYLDYARQLIPSIAVGSGRDIWIVLLDSVKVPPLPVSMNER